MNQAENNLLLPTVIGQFQEWDDERGISERSSAYAQYLKLLEEVFELGRNLQPEASDSQFQIFLESHVNYLYAKGKLAPHPQGYEIGVLDGLGDSLKCLQSVASLSGFSLQEAGREAYNSIKDRTGQLDDNGIWQKE